MIQDGIAVVLILLLLWQPQWLTPFRNAPGRLILVGVVLYLCHQNLLVGCLAATLLITVNSNVPARSISYTPSIDLMKIGNLMRPRDSADTPSAWLTDVPRATSAYEF